jgi:hypothetical protein
MVSLIQVWCDVDVWERHRDNISMKNVVASLTFEPAFPLTSREAGCDFRPRRNECELVLDAAKYV